MRIIIIIIVIIICLFLMGEKKGSISNQLHYICFKVLKLKPEI